MKRLLMVRLSLLGLMFFFGTSLWARPNKKVVVDTLSLVSFNDFHGAFASDVAAPGAGVLVQTVLNQKMKNENTVVLSVGDNFSGSYFSRITRGNPLPEMFKMMDVKMSAIGNHEFDWGLPYLTDTAAVYMNFVVANIIHSEGEGDCPRWAQPVCIVNQPLKNGGAVRVAFVGLTTTDTAHKTSPENIKGLSFINPVYAARVETACRLKNEGKVDMVVLLMHIGTNMKEKGIIEELNAKRLPFIEGIDAIISGHSHEVVLARVNDVPIIQAGFNGSHVGKLNFEVKRKKGRYNISYIGGDTIAATGVSNPYIDSLVTKVVADYGLSERLTTSEDLLLHDRKVKKTYTPVGAYVTAAYAHCFLQDGNLPAGVKALPVFGVNHFGGLRASIPAGEVTRLRAGNVLPFGGDLVAYYFTGERLKQLLNDGRKNPNGFLQSSYLELSLNDEGQIKEIRDTSTGQLVNDEDNCVVVLDAFITSGGDGYNSALFSGYEIPEFNNRKLETTVVLIDYLKGLGNTTISSQKAPLPVVK